MNIILTDEDINAKATILTDALHTLETTEWIAQKNKLQQLLQSYLELQNTFLFATIHHQLVHQSSFIAKRRLRSLFHTTTNRSLAVDLYLRDKRRTLETLFGYLCYPNYDVSFESFEEVFAHMNTFNLTKVHRWLYRDIDQQQWDDMVKKFYTLNDSMDIKVSWMQIEQPKYMDSLDIEM